MNKRDTEYFFEIVDKFEEALPKDLRQIDLTINSNKNVSIGEIMEVISDVFLDLNIETKNDIIVDVEKIINAITKNENTDTITLIGKSRFSLAFKIGSKVFKAGFPKITYKYPKCSIILDSIIRKQYIDNHRPVLFIEVQDFKENDLRKYYTAKELDEVVYQLWKTLRKSGIIWYDPKDKNIVVDNKNNNITIWNDKYYKSSTEYEKGRYIINGYSCDEESGNSFLIVDMDLFLPMEIIEKLRIIYKKNSNLPFFKNWKYKRFLEYEQRFLEEEENETK